jgi:RNA polymerase sigma factor (sigma-70 family)
LNREIEQELIQKCRAGDTRFFEPLVRAYEPKALRLAIGMLGNAEDARDAVQEAFVKGFRGLNRFDSNRAFGPWFFRILRNQCLDQLRSRAARFRMEVLDEGIAGRALGEDPMGRRHGEAAEARKRIWGALDRIPVDHREVLVLKELEGFRYDEIALVLDIPPGTVASRLFHARQSLRKALDEMERAQS